MSTEPKNKTILDPTPRRLRRFVLGQMATQAQIEAHQHQRQPYTCVAVKMTFKGKIIEGLGFSKVCWPDPWSPETGTNLAVNKAHAHIVRQYIDSLNDAEMAALRVEFYDSLLAKAADLELPTVAKE